MGRCALQLDLTLDGQSTNQFTHVTITDTTQSVCIPPRWGMPPLSPRATEGHSDVESCPGRGPVKTKLECQNRVTFR